MISVRSVLWEIPDTRGKKGHPHRLEAILGLNLLSMLTGRTGMMAAYRLGRRLSRSQLNRLGFRGDRQSPCHATLTETLQGIDSDAMARAFSRLTFERRTEEADTKAQLHFAVDGKKLRASKDGEARAEHV